LSVQHVFKNGYIVDTSSVLSNITSISTATGQSATSLKVSNDEYYIYFSIQGKVLGNYGQIFIDSDNNSATGYIDGTWASTGIDYMIESGHLYSHSTHDNSWTWADLGAINVTVSNSTTEYQAKVTKSALSGLGTSIKVGFKDNNSSWKFISGLPASGELPKYMLK